MKNRRTKSEIEQAMTDCKSYLLSESNPHKAWDKYIKYHMENNIQLPYYISGIIRTS